ncbi:hypothetical protein X474_10270 [Dethiosulfatarculus sandiegensis]|uniref:Uncharacterized protein n=1 Tax=Dethiosulfatarculus sandiegensis TaxID=1429043 RepID=A0A0D2JY26_9BACT|nr:hypothetical protein X474_10270 [Dethiosulfatarculus sandiegensis]
MKATVGPAGFETEAFTGVFLLSGSFQVVWAS